MCQAVARTFVHLFVLLLGHITIQIKIHKHDVNWSCYQSMCQDVEYTFVRLVNLQMGKETTKNTVIMTTGNGIIGA